MVRSELVARFLPFAKSVALKYAGAAEVLDDLLQVASLGLMNAIQRFDPARGKPFLSFAAPTINGELRRHFRDRVSGMRLPRGVYERVGQVEAVVADLRQELGREPVPREIAGNLGCDEEQVVAALVAADSRHPVPFQRDADDEPGGVREEHVGQPDGAFDLVDDRIVLAAALQTLTREERNILAFRYRDELSQSEIAARLGCSQMHVSRQLRRILESMNESAALAGSGVAV